MKRRQFLSLVAGSACVPRLLRGQNQTGLVQVDLEAKPARVSFAGVQANLYAYNGQVPGPLIETHPGDTLRLNFTNGLPQATNLHFHGLHVSPAGNSDNSLMMVEAGGQFQYELAIPANHPAGMFWVHPHMHGTVADQVWRGLALPLIVRGDLDAVPEIQSATEVVLVLQDVSLSSSGQPVAPNLMQRMVGREGSLVAASGVSNPKVPIQQNGWVRLRLINASCSRFYRLQVEQHDMYQISTDGGPLPAPLGLSELMLVPGQRADVMIQGSQTPGSYRLLNLPYGRMMGGVVGGDAQTAIATFVYDGQASSPYSLPQTLIPVDTLGSPDLVRRFVLGQTMGMGMMTGGEFFTINGRTFDLNRVDTRVSLGAVEDWEFINPMAMDHPMHIHTNSFQVVGADGAPEAAWRDIVLVKAGQSVRVRMAFRDYSGTVVYHCHILDHEDLGMMGVLQIG